MEGCSKHTSLCAFDSYSNGAKSLIAQPQEMTVQTLQKRHRGRFYTCIKTQLGMIGVDHLGTLTTSDKYKEMI